MSLLMSTKLILEFDASTDGKIADLRIEVGREAPGVLGDRGGVFAEELG
jgi:hypothetical protein